jgi:hypothetical protein
MVKGAAKDAIRYGAAAGLAAVATATRRLDGDRILISKAAVRC